VGDTQYITTKVDEESDLYQRFDRYLEEAGHGNKAAATRQLVKSALDDWEEQAELGYDPDRPDTVLRALLYDAKQLRHTAILISGVLFVAYSMLAAPLSYGFLAVSGAYAATAVLGFVVEPALSFLGRFRVEMDDADDDSGVNA